MPPPAPRSEAVWFQQILQVRHEERRWLQKILLTDKFERSRLSTSQVTVNPDPRVFDFVRRTRPIIDLLVIGSDFQQILQLTAPYHLEWGRSLGLL